MLMKIRLDVGNDDVVVVVGGGGAAADVAALDGWNHLIL